MACAFAACARAEALPEGPAASEHGPNAAAIRLAWSYGVRSLFGGFSFGAFDDIARIRMQMAETYEKRGQYDRAIEAYDHLLKYSPTSSGVLIARAYDLLILHRFDEAMANLNTAVDEGPVKWQGDALSARCYARTVADKDLDAALTDCNKALESQSDDSGYLWHRAFLYYRMGKFAAAKADLDKVLAIDSDDADPRYVRGLVRTRSGDAAGGGADIAAAEKLDPKIADTYAGYGVKP